VTSGLDSEREDDTPTGAIDTPLNGYQGSGADNHSRDDNHRDQQWEPEALENFGYLLEEIRTTDFLDGGRPGYVIGEHMSQDGLADWDTQPAKEEEEERNPHQINTKPVQEMFKSKTILQHRESNSTRTDKDDSCCKPDLETVHIKAVDRELEAQKHVVDNPDSDCTSDTVI